MSGLETEPLIRQPTIVRRVRVRREARSTCCRFCGCFTFGTLVIVLGLYLFSLGAPTLTRNIGRIHSGSFLPADEVERLAMKSIDPSDLKTWCKNYTRKAHLAGQGKDLADWTNEKFEEFGLSSEVVPYYTYLNYPGKSSLALLGSDGKLLFKASLKEDVLEEDPTTSNKDSVPVFHGYSANGTVEGQYVYANYGRKEDYDKLVKLGVQIKGKIVICRYNKIFRGLKVKFAQELGAIGVVIFTDPTDDVGIDFVHGYKPYPAGPARNPTSVQRGSVGFLSYGPGDPTTPGYASHEDAKREDPYDLIPSIPSIPISYADAIPILKELNGKGFSPKDLDSSWGGILEGVNYNVGPSESVLKLVNNQDFAVRPIHNVIATIEGIIPHQAIVVGNHRDAWISGGAGDPNSGSAVLLALAKSLGDLKKKGWRPLRTIILASWDGEEYALLGSTEWGEDHAKFLKKNVVAYVNLDMAVSGSYFTAGASHSLNELVRNVTGKVRYPNSDDTVFHHWNMHNHNHISTLGTGSDYTVFLDHLGIPSIDFAFKPGHGDPIYHYHSNYDSFHWISQLDPDFALHTAASKLLSIFTLTLADRVSLKFHFQEYGTVLKEGLNNILKDHDIDKLSTAYSTLHNHNDDDRNGHDHGNHRNDRNNHRGHNKYKCSATSPKEHLKCLEASIERFTTVGKAHDDYVAHLGELYSQERSWFHFFKGLRLLIKIQAENFKMSYVERFFTIKQGLDNRPWYKHVLVAPNRYLGYGGTTFPGILESLEDNDGNNFIKWASISRGVLDAATDFLS